MQIKKKKMITTEFTTLAQFEQGLNFKLRLFLAVIHNN